MNETLEHHGILGMKWGVRRYQNKDGTWTKEGKEHRAEEKPLFTKEELDAAKSRNMDNDGDWAINDAMFIEVADHYFPNGIKTDSRWAQEFYKFCDNPHKYMESVKKQKEYWSIPTPERAKTPLADSLADTDEYKEYVNSYKKLDDQFQREGKNSKDVEDHYVDALDKATNKALELSREYFGMHDIGYGPAGELVWDRLRLDTENEAKHSDDVYDFLMHYGVKGQSWGKRNYQFEDGTLTEEGKERYSKGLTRSGASVFRSGKPKIGQQVWTAKRSMTKVGDLPEETKEKLLERVRQARQGGAKDEEDSSIPGMTRTFEAKRTEISPEEREKLKSVTPKSLGATQEMVKTELSEMPPEEKEESGIPGMTRTFEAKRTEMSSEEREKLKSATPKSLGATQEMAKTNLSELSPEEKEKLKKKRAASIKPVEPKKAVTMSDSPEDFLEHHGILGMKWGIRRYQNADGSLTAAGRKRYGVDENDGQRSSSGPSSSDSSNSITRTPAKSASEMTDQELNQALNRLRMEQQYNELTGAKSSNQYQNQQNFSTPPSNTGNLSNAELQAYITRLDMEKRYAQLTAPPPKEVSAGKKFMNDVVGPAINQVAKAFIVASLSKALGLKGDGDGGGNNNNNGGNKNKGGNNNDQYNTIKKELNDLKSMMGSQKKQDNGGNQKKESSRDSGSQSSNGLPEPRSTETQKSNTHRDSIFAAARDAAQNAREQRREREREQRRQESREKRERRNAQWSAFLDGLDRQTGGSVDPVTKSYKTRAQSYFDSYLNNMGR